MSMPKTVTLTRTGGHYWRAQAFRVSVALVSLPAVLVVLGLALINPFWFRNQFLDYSTNQLNRFTRWINYQQYAIYLGTDPQVWHSLKGDIK